MIGLRLGRHRPATLGAVQGDREDFGLNGEGGFGAVYSDDRVAGRRGDF